MWRGVAAWACRGRWSREGPRYGSLGEAGGGGSLIGVNACWRVRVCRINPALTPRRGRELVEQEFTAVVRDSLLKVGPARTAVRGRGGALIARWSEHVFVLQHERDRCGHAVLPRRAREVEYLRFTAVCGGGVEGRGPHRSAAGGAEAVSGPWAYLGTGSCAFVILLYS